MSEQEYIDSTQLKILWYVTLNNMYMYDICSATSYVYIDIINKHIYSGTYVHGLYTMYIPLGSEWVKAGAGYVVQWCLVAVDPGPW